jgi:hypothetical protein
MIRLWRAPMFSPLGFVARAALIAIVYFAANAVGLRAYTTVLSGTSPTGDPTDYLSLFAGCAYVILHFLFVVGVPILLAAAGLLALALRHSGQPRR